MPVLMKSSGRVQVEMLTKAGKEGIVYALVYLPDSPDKEGDVASREVIKAMAHDFLTNAAEVGGGIDIEHNFKTLGPDQVRLAETFIVQKGDPRFEGWKDNDGNLVNPEGSWGIALKVLDPTLRSEFENGELNGVSMYGFAELETIGKSEDRPHNLNKQDDDKMTPQEMKELATEIAKAIQPAAPAAPEVPTKVEFEGDPFNPEDVARHAETVLFKSLDLAKPADLKRWQDHLAKKAALAKAVEQGQDPNAAEIARLEGEIARLKKGSSAPVTPQPEKPETTVGNLQKAEAAQFEAGRKAMRKFQGLSVEGK
jgi:hypothetical protein